MDSLTVFHAPATVVRGQRRSRSKVDSLAWSRPSPLGTAGAVESLRERPGVSSEGEFSGNISTSGMPTEGSVITWEGAQILWPWHFGGLFGNLDEWATGSVDWHDPGDGGSPDQGGGWLETKSRAWQDSDGVHGGVRLGYVAGGLATWGRQGDWGWQFGYRRTWLDGALALAKDEGWTDQDMAVRYQDANAALSWQHGPWKALVGWFGSEDTLGIREDNVSTGFSWRNLTIPLRLSFHNEDWESNLEGSWSRYHRFDSDLGFCDTFSLLRFSEHISRHWDEGSLEGGLRGDLWHSGHGEEVDSPREAALRRRLNVLVPWLGTRTELGPFSLHGWAGLVHSKNDDDAPQAGIEAQWQSGGWRLETDLERKVLAVTQLDQSQDFLSISPAWTIVPGNSPRSTLLRLSIERTTAFGNAQLRLAAVGWLRLLEDFWSWRFSNDRVTWTDSLIPYRSEGWGRGAELSTSLAWGRLDASGRIALSADVLRAESDGATSFWAPWDQRLHGQGKLSWRWKGEARPAPGTFHWESELTLSASSGLARSRILAWSIEDSERDLNGPYGEYNGEVRVRSRVPYFRLDLTPLRLGRQGRWSAWWTIVNLTNETNTLGWADLADGNYAYPLSQISFLPVVFGAQIEF